MSEREANELTRDELFDGELGIWQRRKGYRFGLDALLLATDLPELPPAATVVELGAGQGAVCLSVAHKHRPWQVVAVERQPSLLELLRRNVAENQLNNVRVVAGDLREHRELMAPHQADLVLCNPPFYPPGSRRPSPNQERAAARHELYGDVGDFVRAAAYILGQRGWLRMITPPVRMTQVLSAAEGTDLSLESLRFYHTDSDQKAYLVEYRWRRGGAPDLKIRPPLYIYHSRGIYTEEVAARVGREGR